MQNPDNFNLFYNQTIQPELQRLDRLRLRLIRVLLFSLLALIALLVVDRLINVFALTLLLAIPVVWYLITLFIKFRAFIQEFKPRVVRLILDFIDDGLLFGDLKYQAEGMIPVQHFLESGIFICKPEEYVGEDYIEGRIGDIEFEMCELKVREMSRVRARLDEVFRGLFIRAKFVHAPKGSLLIMPKVNIPKLSQTLKSFVGAGGYCVDNQIDHAIFTSIFTVYASRNTRISDLLPPELVDSILKCQHQKGPFSISFHNKYIFAAIPNEKDILEPKLFQSNVSYDLVREFYDDIYISLNLIIEFDKVH